MFRVGTFELKLTVFIMFVTQYSFSFFQCSTFLNSNNSPFFVVTADFDLMKFFTDAAGYFVHLLVCLIVKMETLFLVLILLFS